MGCVCVKGRGEVQCAIEKTSHLQETLQERILLPLSRMPLVQVFSLTAAMCLSFVSCFHFLWRIMLDVESGAWRHMHIAVIYLSFADGQ